MSARTISPGKPASAPVSPRFDRKFIEDHKLVDRYLENKLPVKGARDLENWFRAHPEYLDELQLSERAAASLKLLEASGRPQDLSEPTLPWWKTIYALIGLCALTLVSLLACWVMVGKYAILQYRFEAAQQAKDQGPLVQPATEAVKYVSPDH